MNALASSLALVLALQDMTPDRCADDDNACNARRFEQRAGAATSPRQRALHLHNAHLSFRDLYDQTHAPRDLCDARRTFDASVSVDGQPENQRASFEAERANLEKREQAAGIRCKAKDASKSGRLVAAASKKSARITPTPAPPAPPVAPTETSTEPPPPLLAPSPPAPTEPPAASTEPPPPLLVAAPSPAREANPLLPVPRSSVAANPRPARSLVIAGGATIIVGLGLFGAAGYTISQVIDARREQWTLWSSAGGIATNEQHLAEQAELRRRDETMQSATFALAVTGGAAVVVGAVLARVGARRLARTSSRTALLPAPGGLVLRARF